MLSLSKLNVSFDGSRILRDVSLKVAPGQVVCLMGRNGVGKTTTLRTIVEDNRNGWLPVAASAAKFLQEIFRRGRVLPVYDQAHVGNVEAHSERISADDVVDARLALPHETLEQFLPLEGRAELGMKERNVDAKLHKCSFEILSDLGGRHENHRLPPPKLR